MTAHCPLCRNTSQLFRTVEGMAYFECVWCEFLFADPVLLERADAGEALREYDESYWRMELDSARDRAFGSSVARLAETILYARRPIQRFIDIYTGPGYFLDAVRRYLPQVSERFFGVELFPPPMEFRTKHPNYRTGDLGSLSGKFQAGLCVEVMEHLTPNMARKLAEDLASVSEAEAFYLFNTGLVSYVKKEDPGYLDPLRRGHITCWSVAAAKRLFEPLGFSVFPIRGKSWAFGVEFQSQRGAEFLNERIWTADAENKKMLTDPENGSLMYVLGIDTARVYE